MLRLATLYTARVATLAVGTSNVCTQQPYLALVLQF